MKLVENTPIEIYVVRGHEVYVKREDLSTPAPGPSFSKVRGLMPVLQRLKAEGITTVGYTETSVSMAGIGVAAYAQELGMRAIIYDPQYKETPELLAYHRTQWERFGAETVPQKAGMAKVNYNIAKNHMRDNYERSYLLPLGLPFPETVEGTRQEVLRTRASKQVDPATIVVSVGSGTICAGVLKGYFDKVVHGVLCRTGNIDMKAQKIADKAGLSLGGFMGVDLRLHDPGWEYTQACSAEAPFPCHPWYDAKGWLWLVENIHALEAPVLFWNVGSLPADYRG